MTLLQVYTSWYILFLNTRCKSSQLTGNNYLNPCQLNHWEIVYLNFTVKIILSFCLSISYAYFVALFCMRITQGMVCGNHFIYQAILVGVYKLCELSHKGKVNSLNLKISILLPNLYSLLLDSINTSIISDKELCQVPVHRC